MSELQNAKAVVRTFYDALDHAGPSDTVETMARHCTPDLVWRGFHPFNEIIGSEQVAKQFWVPLITSLTSLQRRLDLFFCRAQPDRRLRDGLGRNDGTPDGAV